MGLGFSVIQTLSLHGTISEHFGDGKKPIETYEVAEELFWALMPHFGSD